MFILLLSKNKYSSSKTCNFSKYPGIFINLNKVQKFQNIISHNYSYPLNNSVIDGMPIVEARAKLKKGSVLVCFTLDTLFLNCWFFLIGCHNMDFFPKGLALLLHFEDHYILSEYLYLFNICISSLKSFIVYNRMNKVYIIV